MFWFHRNRVGLREFLAWYHLAAGIAGAVAMMLVSPSIVEQLPVDVQNTAQLVFLSLLLLFAMLGTAGVLLFSPSRRGTALAAGMQVLQLPVFVVPPLKWVFFGGIYLVPLWGKGAGLGLQAGLKANVQVGWAETGPLLAGVNLVPLVVLWLLLRKLPSNEALKLTARPASGEPPVESAAHVAGTVVPAGSDSAA